MSLSARFDEIHGLGGTRTMLDRQTGLGFDLRMHGSRDEYYLPADQRPYRVGQR